jgi:hypothetical protein
MSEVLRVCLVADWMKEKRGITGPYRFPRRECNIDMEFVRNFASARKAFWEALLGEWGFTSAARLTNN